MSIYLILLLHSRTMSTSIELVVAQECYENFNKNITNKMDHGQKTAQHHPKQAEEKKAESKEENKISVRLETAEREWGEMKELKWKNKKKPEDCWICCWVVVLSKETHAECRYIYYSLDGPLENLHSRIFFGGGCCLYVRKTHAYPNEFCSCFGYGHRSVRIPLIRFNIILS